MTSGVVGEQQVGQKPDKEAPNKSALRLLLSLARTSRHPDRFDEFCLDWADLAAGANATPEFSGIVDQFEFDKNSVFGRFGAGEERRARVSHYGDFTINRYGKVAEISEDMAAFLGVKTGGDASALFIDPEIISRLAGGADEFPHCLTEIIDAHKVRRLAHIRPAAASVDERGEYVVQVAMPTIPQKTRAHIARQYGVTQAEFEVINLTMQRFTPNEISKIRNVSLNTVRTHINRIIGKFNARSLIEVVSCVHEVMAFVEEYDRFEPLPKLARKKNETSQLIELKSHDATFEYLQFGPPEGKPMVVLHSLEFGYFPPDSFVAEAEKRNYSLYFPLRPGFGETTPAPNIDTAAGALGGFLAAMKIEDATLVAVAMAAPVGLHVYHENKRVKKLFLINYSLNAEDKISTIEPRWVQGMIRLAFGSQSMFAYGLKTGKAMIRTVGAARFFNLLYAGISVDQDFARRHQDDFRRIANIILDADGEAIRRDLVSAFSPMQNLEDLLRDKEDICVINGELQHNAPASRAIAESQRLGLKFRMIEGGGRNCIFQQPSVFFDMVDAQRPAEQRIAV